MTDDPELRRFESLRQKHAQTLAEFRLDEELIDGKYVEEIIPEKWEDEGLDPTVMPTAYDVVENAVDHILTTPRIRVPVLPTDEDLETQRQIAERKRYFLQHYWDLFAVHEGDVVRRAIKSLVKGKMVWKFEVNWSAIPDPPDTEGMSSSAKSNALRKYRRQLERVSRSKQVFKLSVIPKETVFEDATQPWNPRYVYQHYNITREDANEAFGDATVGDTGETVSERWSLTHDPDGEIEYTELWIKPSGKNKGRYICWLDGERVHDAPNPYCWETELSTPESPDYDGFLPYVIRDPGWGDTDKDAKPENRYVSILRPLRSLLKAETRQITEVEAWLRLYMWKPVIGTNLPEVEEGEDDMQLGPGAFWNLNKEAGQAVDVLQFGEAPVTVFQFLGKVQQAANQSSKFGALGGTPQQGVSTATESDSLTRNAQTKLAGPLNAVRSAMQQVNAYMQMCVDKVLEAPVSVSGSFNFGPAEVTLRPSDINGFYATTVELDTSDKEMLDARKARLWADLYRIFTGLSERRAMYNAGIDDPTSEQDERAVEDLMKSPQMQQVQLLLALTGMGQQAEEVSEAFRQMLTNPQPGGGPRNPGDAGMMTSVNSNGTPEAPATSAARAQFVMGDQMDRMYQ